MRDLPKIKGYTWRCEQDHDWKNAGEQWYAYLWSRDGKRAGHLSIVVHPDRVTLRLIVLGYSYRGQGLASKMLDGFLATYADLPVRLRISAAPNGALDNDQLQAWYTRRGFVLKEPLMGWYERPARMEVAA